jgi:spermidine synthase
MPPTGDTEFGNQATAGAGGSSASPTKPGSISSFRQLVPFLTLLFAASGCAALIYEIIWFQMLQLVIGSTAVSLGVLLTSFMSGLCLGSVLLPRYLSPTIHPLRVWAFLELSIGGLGIAVLFVVPWLAKVYTAFTPSGPAGVLFRGIICAACLLPPTTLMGATLPTISRLAETTRDDVSHLGLIYGANTLGAVIGSLLAGFYLLRVYDVFTATCVAAAINGIIALIGFGLKVRAFHVQSTGQISTTTHSMPWPVYVAVALSGLCALGAEVVWTRLLSLMLGGTIYTFSIILAVFLLGLAIGNAIGATVARQSPQPGRALGLCQLVLTGAIAWAAFMLARSLPYWPIEPALAKSVWLNFQVDFVRCLWAILPATCLWGATFPLALAAAAEPGRDSGVLVGRLYAANTIGAIFGAVSCSVLLIAWLGTQQTQRLLVALSAAAGLLVLFWFFPPARSEVQAGDAPRARKTGPTRAVLFFAACAVCVLLAWSVPRIPWPLIAYGRYLPAKTELGSVLYVGEGMNASVAVTELDSGVRNFHVSGKIEASTDQQDMRLQRMLGHIPALFHPDPRSILVVGCGAGVTAGSFLAHPRIERITLCEIEPLIPKVVARYFGQENYDVVQDPRVRLIYDDARHFILTTRDRFDVITSDPIHPWVKGAANLYTKEYFELCKRHLNSGGMVTQWVPMYESNLEAVKSEIATFFAVFPEGTIWSNENMGEGYDLVLLGQVGPLEVDVETLQRRLNRADHQMVLQSLRDVGIRSAFGLVATYAGQSRDLAPWLTHAEINRDRDLRLQYLAGMGLNAKETDLIYTSLASYRRFPDEIFVGANTWNDALRRTIGQPKSTGQGQSSNFVGAKGHEPHLTGSGTNSPQSGRVERGTGWR